MSALAEVWKCEERSFSVSLPTLLPSIKENLHIHTFYVSLCGGGGFGGWLFFLKGFTSFCAFTYGYNIVLYSLVFSQVHFLLFRAYFVSLNRIFKLWVVAHIKFYF